jgi:hypothetical protein
VQLLNSYFHLQEACKRKHDDNPDWTAKKSYNYNVNRLPITEAAVSVQFTAVERTLQRYIHRNRPPLPATRHDLLLLPEHRLITDGRRLLLIDDGLVDRILVFGTNENLTR